MPLVPDWLVPILRQIPIVGLVVGIVWIVVKWLERRSAADLAREQARLDAFVARAEAEVQRAIRDRDRANRERRAEVERITELYRGEIDRLRSRVIELERLLFAPGDREEA